MEGERWVLKHTWPGTFGYLPLIQEGAFSTEWATPEEYIWRLGLQNKVFGDEIHVEGLIQLPYEKSLLESPGMGWSVVTSQPFRKGISPSMEAIEAFMQENNFRKTRHFHTWYRPQDGILIADAHRGNFISAAGCLFPIDLHISQFPRDTFISAGWPV